jgi:hypothetical protein
MGPKQVTVKAEWPPEAKVRVASSDDIPGLITEAETVDALAEKFSIMIPSYWKRTVRWQAMPPASYLSVSSPTANNLCYCATKWPITRLREADSPSERVLFSSPGGRMIMKSGSSITNRYFPLDNKILSRHTANGILKQAVCRKNVDAPWFYCQKLQHRVRYRASLDTFWAPGYPNYGVF